MNWWLLVMITMAIFRHEIGGRSIRSYRVTLEKITLSKSEGSENHENLFGTVWAGAFCNSNENQVGASFDSRERTLKLFDRTSENYIRLHENRELLLNHSLVFDIPPCGGNQANLTLTASLNNQNLGRKYTTEQQRVYLSEIRGPTRRTIHCYERDGHVQLSFLITQL
ncbi:hypothetical protein [Runella salmonicolor]|uniref:Uncharacterized protein n=1 Tax=Runella salmonicolor TaxID=2950278 RepID=A0ABT1FRV1_9BACT|nr:hypothetical protein [Runella salmonicolor]MCP1384496.1 hypothetical protein [Runella salmonicolor]